MIKTDVLIIGAGGAGMMCAIQAGKRGRKVILLDHAKKIGGKILILPIPFVAFSDPSEI
jgi:predicted flavoprotein YhiN